MSEKTSSTHKRNIAGIQSFVSQKSDIAMKKAEDTISRLVKQRERVNFNVVSQESGVSKAFLYKTKRLRDRIVAIRKLQETQLLNGRVRKETSESSKDVIIAAKSKRIKDLEEENKRLKEELMRLRGKVYDMEG